MLNKPIAVLGGGNGGHVMSADLTLGGYDVHFYEHPQFAEKFKPTLESGEIEIYDDGSGRTGKARLRRVTTDIRKALEDVTFIFIILPSFGHDIFFNELIPHLKDGHVVCLFAANSGALRLREMLRQKAPGRKLALYETATIPCGGRLIGPAKVRAFARNFGPWFGPKPRIHVEQNFVISGLPGKENRGLQEIIKLYPAHIRVKNVAVVALNSPHHFIHTPVVILNTGRIEGIKEDFIILRDGQTPSVLRVGEAICEELENMVRALGDTVTLSKKVPQNWKDIVTKFPIVFAKSTQAIEGNPGLRDRFVTEDVPYGLVPMTELARKLNVATSVMDSFVVLASVINREDYRETGRNLKTLGLDQLNKEQILNLLEKEDLP